MFVSKLKYNVLIKGTTNFLIRSVCGRYPFRFASSSVSKATEQLDIDKKNGALAYVPSDTGFDLEPLTGNSLLLFV